MGIGNDFKTEFFIFAINKVIKDFSLWLLEFYRLLE